MTREGDDLPVKLPGQMEVEECIEVAEQGLDGKPAHNSPKRDSGQVSPDDPKPLTTKQVVAQRLKET